MSDPKVAVFFYGSYMNRAVLAEVSLAPDSWETATLDGYEIRIAPRANLVPAASHTVYGVLSRLTHAELERLYAHAHDVLGETYLPHPVLVKTRDGVTHAALCYLASRMVERPAEPAYVERILAPARQLGFPEKYLRRIAGFSSRARAGS